MNRKKIANRIIIICIIILFFFLIYLCVPFRSGTLSDGGSKVWEAKIYTVVYWNKLPIIDEETNLVSEDTPRGWKIYIWPNNHEWETK